MKELRRSRTERWIAGVCGGIGEYLDVDANAIRLIWIVVTIFTIGIGVLLYLLAWLVIPEEGAPATGTAPPGGGAEAGAAEVGGAKV